MLPRKNKQRPVWFKIFLHQRSIIDAVPDDVAGKALKAALLYFENQEEMMLDPLSAVVFSSLKQSVDEAFSDYLRDMTNGAKGGRPKKPPVTEGNPWVASPPQEEKEVEKEVDAEDRSKKKCGETAKLPTRHKHGAYSNVLLTDDDLLKLKTEFPSDWDGRIDKLSEYMASTGKRYKCHLATIRNWARREQEVVQNNGKADVPSIRIIDNSI